MLHTYLTVGSEGRGVALAVLIESYALCTEKEEKKSINMYYT